MSRIRLKLISAMLICSLSAMSLSGCENVYVEEEADDTTVSTDSPTIDTAETEISDTPSEETDGADAVVSFSHDSGIYGEGFNLSMTTDGGEIYYTTDGSDPATSKTAVLYASPLPVMDRSGDKNVVSAVDPVLFSGNYSLVNKDRNGFDSEISPPPDDAVDKCTVIRAAVKNADGTFGKECSSTYFIGTPEEHIEGLAKSC